MQDPIKPSKDVVMLGQLPADDFEASVSKAREAARARIGLPAETPRSPFESVTQRPRPLATPGDGTPSGQTTPMHAHPAHAHAPHAHTGPTPSASPAGSHGHSGPFAQASAPHAAPLPIAAPRAVVTPISAASHASPHVATMPHVAAANAGSQSVFHNATTSSSARRGGVRVSLPMIGGVFLVLAAIGGGLLYFGVGGLSLSASRTPPAPTTGTVHVVSRPAGANVIVDGTPRGAAPLELTLTPGAHTLELQSGGTKRSLPLAIEAGMIVRQYVDFAAPAAATGTLEITSEPAGADVLVDGAPRGTTPLIVADVAPGSHTVAIGSGTSTVLRTVEVTAGATASVVVSIAPTEGAAGWVTLKAPFPMEMREGERLLASSSVDRVMLPTGRHTLELVATEYEFTTTVNVTVAAGKTAVANVVVPNGKLSINAAPWAEVWLDGKAMGTTPLGNLSVPIGTHEIVWKHPQHGERRQLVKVPAQTPVRASMDFGK